MLQAKFPLKGNSALHLHLKSSPKNQNPKPLTYRGTKAWWKEGASHIIRAINRLVSGNMSARCIRGCDGGRYRLKRFGVLGNVLWNTDSEA